MPIIVPPLVEIEQPDETLEGDDESMGKLTLSEPFDNDSGRFDNYDAYTELANVSNLKHRDIRVMQQSSLTAAVALRTSRRAGESWTGGTVASDSSRGGLRVLSASLVVGSNVIQSIMSGYPVDLLSDFEDNDIISMALPAFPASSITQSTSFLDFSSHPDGSFSDSQQVSSVAFSSSLTALTDANSEFRAPRSAFTKSGFDLSKVTAVRLRVTATGAATFRLMAIRLMGPDWTLGQVDFDTRYERLVKTVPRNGDINASRFTQPILWRSQEPSNEADPKPVDAEMAITFNSGALVYSNSVSIYFREVTEDFMTMLDLNGLTMAEMNGRVQPDVGTARYTSRTMDDLAQFTHNQLYGETMFSLERKADYLSASWINFILTWTASSTELKIGNTESGNSALTGLYTFPSISLLTPNTDYVWFVKLDEHKASSAIYTVAADGSLGTLVFDSGEIDDDIALHRRKGRFGWHANVADGSAYVEGIRVRKLSYAEYRSLPFQSITPVEGAELYYAGSGNVEHFTGLNAYRTVDEVLINRDSSRSTSGSSWRLDNLAAEAAQGVMSNSFDLEDLEDTEISFDVWYTADSTNPLKAYLYSESERLIEIPMVTVTPHQWQRVNLKVPTGHRMFTGTYRFVLLQTLGAPLSWWIDSVSIFSRSVVWDGRAIVDDPWKSNAEEARWVPFKNALNDSNAGIMFAYRGKELQVRAKAAHPSAHIDRVQFKPRYAPLGRFKPKDFARNTAAPTASFTTTNEGNRTILFTSTSTTPSGYIINNEWDFGDGTLGANTTARHTYNKAGTYTVTLVSTNSKGNSAVATVAVNIA